jgi:hypothetical protein
MEGFSCASRRALCIWEVEVIERMASACLPNLAYTGVVMPRLRFVSPE